MTPSEFSERLWEFSVRVAKVVERLPDTRMGRHIAGQLCRCGTSSAPNYDEAAVAESRADFVHKLNVSWKEMRETRGWLRFISKLGLLSQKRMAPLIDESEQLSRLLSSSVATAKGKARLRAAAPSSIPNPQSSILNPQSSITASPMTRPTFRQLFSLLGPFLGLLFVIGIFSIKPEVRAVFLTGGNFKIIFTQTVIVAIGALGMTLIIVSGGIDLSVGSIVALTSVVGAKLLSLPQPWSTPAVIAATVLAGGIVGAINGSLIAGLRMMPFIVTLGMMGVARGAAKWLGENQTVNYDEKAAVNTIMALDEPYKFFPLPTGVWIAIVLAIIMAIVLRQTVFGRYVFAIGSNEATARLCGIRVRMQKIIIYSLAGLLFGAAGLMQLSRLTQGDPTVAIGLELDIIAAVVIGGASLSGGTGSILGSMIGAVIMAVLRNGSNQMGWPTYMQEIIIGIVIVLAVALDKFRQSKQA